LGTVCGIATVIGDSTKGMRMIKQIREMRKELPPDLPYLPWLYLPLPPPLLFPFEDCVMNNKLNVFQMIQHYAHNTK
jgi:hypothetical protein